MRVLQSTSTNPSGVLEAALSNIRELAEQVICDFKHMVDAPYRPDLKRLPAALLVNPSLKSLIPHNHKDMVCIRIIANLII